MNRNLTNTWIGFLSALIMLSGPGCGRDDIEPSGPEEAADTREREGVRRFWYHYRQATDLRQRGEFEAARTSYLLALIENDDHEDALYYLGNVNMELDSWVEAEASWRRLIEINAASSRAHSQLGRLYLCRPDISLFDMDSARASFDRAHDLNPEETGPLLHLGEVALLAGKLDRAAAYFDAVTGSNNASLEAVFLTAYTEARRGRIEGALVGLNEALDAMRNTPDSAVPGEGDTRPGEGDTRPGAGSTLARGAGCPLFKPFAEALETAEIPIVTAMVTSQFERLNRLIADIQKRVPK